MKNTIIAFTLIIGIGGAGMAYYHHKRSFQATGELNGERYERMVAEESLLKASERVESLEKEITSVKLQLDNTKKLLEQTTALRSDLQSRLDKSEEAKELLERKVRDFGKAVTESLPTAVSTGDI